MKKDVGKARARSSRARQRAKDRSKEAPRRDAPGDDSDSNGSDDGLVPVSKQDHLEEDAAIPGQAYVCVSFVCPEDVLPRKEAYTFEKYVERVFSSKVDAFADAVAAQPEKVREFTDTLKSSLGDVQQDYATFLANTQVQLDAEFSSMNPSELTVSGFKVRGSYPDIEAARKRAEALQRKDRSVDVFVAQVGAWCPFNPQAESVGDVVYDETQLNTIMKMKKEADEHKARVYDTETSDRVHGTRRDVGAMEVLDAIAEDEEDEDAQAEDAQAEDAQAEDAQAEDAQAEDAQAEDAQAEDVSEGV